VCGWQVKLCDLLVSHVIYLSALKMHHDKSLYRFNSLYYIFALYNELLPNTAVLIMFRPVRLVNLSFVAVRMVNSGHGDRC